MQAVGTANVAQPEGEFCTSKPQKSNGAITTLHSSKKLIENFVHLYMQSFYGVERSMMIQHSALEPLQGTSAHSVSELIHSRVDCGQKNLLGRCLKVQGMIL